MLVLGVPDVVVRELVHVHLEPTVVVEVHVGHEELCDEPSISLPIQFYQFVSLSYMIY